MSNSSNSTQRRNQQQRAQQAKEIADPHGVERGPESSARDAADAQSVEREDVSTMGWVRPSNLDAPPPRPGYVQRWKRHRLNNEMDLQNWNRALREGWRPRRASEVPEEYGYLRGHVEGIGDVISASGLILCEMSAKAAKQRDDYYSRATEQQMRGVEEDLDRNRPGNRHHDKRRTETEIGRRPTVAD